MKKFVLLFGIFTVVASTVSGNDITVDSLATYSPVGPGNGLHLMVINNATQLKEYLEVTDYDTSHYIAQPDFTSKTLIGLGTITGGGNRINYLTIKRVYNDNDSVFIVVKPDSQIFDIGLSMQAFSKILLFAIPKTDKPIAIKLDYNTAVEKGFHRGTVFCAAQQKPASLYSLLGRSLSSKNSHTYRVVIFSGVQNRGKTKIIE